MSKAAFFVVFALWHGPLTVKPSTPDECAAVLRGRRTPGGLQFYDEQSLKPKRIIWAACLPREEAEKIFSSEFLDSASNTR